MSLKGFEPPTHGLEGRCSIQLSYWTIFNLVVTIRSSPKITVYYYTPKFEKKSILITKFFT